MRVVGGDGCSGRVVAVGDGRVDDGRVVGDCFILGEVSTTIVVFLDTVVGPTGLALLGLHS